jgi:hypothetical protein
VIVLKDGSKFLNDREEKYEAQNRYDVWRRAGKEEETIKDEKIDLQNEVPVEEQKEIEIEPIKMNTTESSTPIPTTESVYYTCAPNARAAHPIFGSNPTASVSSSLPMFMRPDGEKQLADLRAELETYLNLLNIAPSRMNKETDVACNPSTLQAEEVGEKQAADIRRWWKDNKTAEALSVFMFSKKHKCDGKSWSAGGMGSRWTDIALNGRKCRIAFYSKKLNPRAVPWDTHFIGKSYVWIVDGSN